MTISIVALHCAVASRATLDICYEVGILVPPFSAKDNLHLKHAAKPEGYTRTHLLSSPMMSNLRIHPGMKHNETKGK